MVTPPTVLLVGCGNMGRALLSGWHEHGDVASSVTVIEPDPARASELATRFDVSVLPAPDALREAEPADVVVFAVKPHVMAQVAPRFAHLVPASSLFISVAAGVTIDAVQRDLGPGAPVVRVMPNTPATVRCGVSVAYASATVTEAQRTAAHALLAAVGSVHWINDETLMDAVTAVSGSGPAYVFLLTECLAAAGVEAGLPAELAEQLARETVIGAAALMREARGSAQDLRRQVTSPGGTTEAALKVLQREGGLPELLNRAVDQAARRARELGDATFGGPKT